MERDRQSITDRHKHPMNIYAVFMNNYAMPICSYCRYYYIYHYTTILLYIGMRYTILYIIFYGIMRYYTLCYIVIDTTLCDIICYILFMRLYAMRYYVILYAILSNVVFNTTLCGFVCSYLLSKNIQNFFK